MNHTGSDGSSSPLTAAGLAKLASTTKAQILAYENGHRTPDPQRIRELAEHLGVRPIDLMNRDRQSHWDVATMRRANGLTAKELSAELSISPKSYRRFEQQGVVPVRRPRFLDDVGTTLRISRSTLHTAIDNIPAVIERQHETEQIIQALARTYVARPGIWKGPDLEDPGVVKLSVMYGRPPQRIRRILTRLLGELRQTSVRMRRERILADFGTELSSQQTAKAAVERWREIFVNEMLRIPGRLEGFHRSAQPSAAWQVMVDLYDSETRPEGVWVVSAHLGRLDVMEELPPSLVTQWRFDGIRAAALTSVGYRHVRQYQDMYLALYPGLRRPRPRTKRSGSRTSTTFTIPGRSERFTIPPSTIDRLLLTSTGSGPWEMQLSPTIRLTISSVGGRPVGSVQEDMPTGRGAASPSSTSDSSDLLY
ncbi:helix-turn-helix domain-containing protein [Streptomyces clavifer]|uniref:helix-turn-helix domain-containing protein n=1 Tax=Streptomyces clavifer TaxID=68188 RepID=UPI00340DB50A